MNGGISQNHPKSKGQNADYKGQGLFHNDLASKVKIFFLNAFTSFFKIRVCFGFLYFNVTLLHKNNVSMFIH